MSDSFGSSTGQMVAAMASVVVEYAPDEADRLWRGAGLDVRLAPAKAAAAASWRVRVARLSLLSNADSWAATATMVFYVGLFAWAVWEAR